MTRLSIPVSAGRSRGYSNAHLVAIVEAFDSDQGFIQTSDNIQIVEGQVRWHFKRDGGKQYVYRSIPAFSGNVRLMVRGQVDSWTNNCHVQAGIAKSRVGRMSVSKRF